LRNDRRHTSCGDSEGAKFILHSGDTTMKIQPYRMLIGVALALLAGAVGAQGNTTSSGTAEPSHQSTAKMSGQSDTRAQASGQEETRMHGHKAGHSVRHAARKAARNDQMATRGDQAYRQALRQCVEEKDPSQRDSCLDNAIDQFQRNT
jgi:hypothetical protein